MPIYEYICGKCGKRFEKRQGFHEEPVALCPLCNGDSKRLIQCVPVIFRGSGFYVTDYKKENACVSSPEAGKETAAAVGSEVKKDSAPAATSEVKKDSSPTASKEAKCAESKGQDSCKGCKAAS